jgi:hypothetical protein
MFNFLQRDMHRQVAFDAIGNLKIYDAFAGFAGWASNYSLSNIKFYAE